MSSKYTESHRIEIIEALSDKVLRSQEGLNWCSEYGLKLHSGGLYSLEDYHEDPIPFDMSICLRNFDYSDKRIKWLIQEINNDDMYTMFCSIQDILFGECWIF